MVRGESWAGGADDRTAPVEADADGIVRALSDGHGPEFSYPADAKLVAAGSDADFKCVVVLDSYLAADAVGQPVSRVLAESSGTRLEERSARCWHDRGRPRIVRAGLQGDLNASSKLFFF